MLPRISAIVILMLLIGSMPSLAVERVYRIANQPDSPVKIVKYEAQLQQGGGEYWNGGQQGVYQTVEYENVSGRQIVAVQFSFFTFDVWNEPMTSMSYSSIYSTGELVGEKSDIVEDIAPGNSNRLVNMPNLANPNLFLTGIAGVTKVRFADGEVWTAESKDIVMQLSDNIPDLESRFFTPSG
jgi:hypothetical protein